MPYSPVLTRQHNTFRTPTFYLWPTIAFTFLVGSFVNALSYDSFAPPIVASLVGLAGFLVLKAFQLSDERERKAYCFVFALCWVMAGVAAVYANTFDDDIQNRSDASSFYHLASGDAAGLSLSDVKVLTEGEGAVVLWKAVYDLFASLGFDKGRYIGISINILFVSLTNVIAIKTAKLILGEDPRRLTRTTLLFSAAGLMWLFAALHLRDALVLIIVSWLTYFWVKYLAKPGTTNLVLLIIGSVLSFVSLSSVRVEFVFVPLAMMLAGVASMLFFTRATGVKRFAIYAIAAVGIVIFALAYNSLQDERAIVIQGQEGYADLSVQSSSADSLGVRYIVRAPLPIRLVLGGAYLFMVPIPFWSGFQSESAYDLFKSLNAVLVYFAGPLCALGMWRFVTGLRTAPIMFLSLSLIGLDLAVAATSLESRHLGAFWVPFVVLASVPNLALHADRIAYRKILIGGLVLMALIHLLWAILKFMP